MMLDSYLTRFSHCKSTDDLLLEKHSVCNSLILNLDSVCYCHVCSDCPVEQTYNEFYRRLLEKSSFERSEKKQE